jgi:hypothetical protein
VNRGNDGLGAVIDGVQYVAKIGPFHGLAELGYVGAGEEGATCARQDDGLDLVIRKAFADSRIQAATYVYAEGVYRRIVDRDEADTVDDLERGNGHSFLLKLPIVADSLTHEDRRALSCGPGVTAHLQRRPDDAGVGCG